MEYQHSETVILSYEIAGTGSRPLILFHGFGLTKESFRSWDSKLGHSYKLISIDLFYHGESQKPLGPLDKEAWIEIMQGLLKHLKIDRFSVGGFSLGGRFAIPIAIEMSFRCDNLFLVGPDAIYKTPWFIAATHPLLRWIFKYCMKNPKALDRLIRRAVKLRLISKYLADFVGKELGHYENRTRVYNSWNHFKPLGYTKSILRQKFSSSPYSKHLILGSKDIVIHPTKILPIIDGCGFQVSILKKKHHQLMTEETAEIIRQNQSEERVNL